MKNTSAFINYLETIANSDEDTIIKFVANEALDRDNSEVIPWFEHILRNGCESGTVNELIYYKDTSAFFDTFYEDILFIRDAYQDKIGGQMKLEYDIKDHLAKFSFRYVVKSLYKTYKMMNAKKFDSSNFKEDF